jgi:hypothetical protein
MTEWLSANWIWILLVLGVGWLLLRRGGTCCGMGGHGYRRDPAPRARELDPGDHDESSMTTNTGATAGSRRRGGCH